jgi:hypothetical protein
MYSCFNFFMPNIFLFMLVLSSCAFIHRHQVQNVDSRILHQEAKPFEFMLSETGIELAEGAAWVRAFSTSRDMRQGAEGIAAIVGLIQMGPRTGKPVYNLQFVDQLHAKVQAICPPDQEVSGLTFLREMNNYPVVSGEIIKVSGYCVKRMVP